MEHTTNFRDDLIEDLKNPEYAVIYLNVAIEELALDGDRTAFLQAIANILKAHPNNDALAKAITPLINCSDKKSA